jgi:hypothetical protein
MDPESTPDPDQVAAAYEQISDLSQAAPYASAPDYIDKVLGRFA